MLLYSDVKNREETSTPVEEPAVRAIVLACPGKSARPLTECPPLIHALLGARMMSVVQATTQDHAEVHGLCCGLKPYQCQWAKLPPGDIVF